MMERPGQVLTRAKLVEDVWNYKFVPETNLVDVHIGKLRRKIDGSNEAPMIRNVRGAGSFSMRPTKPPSRGDRPERRCGHEQRRQISLQRFWPRSCSEAATIKERHVGRTCSQTRGRRCK